MAKVKAFLKDSFGELRKVNWPTKDDVVATTTAVLVITAIFSFFIYISDMVLSTVIQYIYRLIG